MVLKMISTLIVRDLNRKSNLIKMLYSKIVMVKISSK